VKRGEIYVIDLGPGVGREPAGVSPVVIVSSDVTNLVPLLVSVVPAVNVADPNAVMGILMSKADSGFRTISRSWHGNPAQSMRADSRPGRWVPCRPN
jgi:mRNA-degrading endonuclease toxin of MazEF toxin-antitoxin module